MLQSPTDTYVAPQAQKVASKLKRDAAPGNDNAADTPTGKFVWHKKIEKQILDGAKVKDLTVKAERQRHLERQVRLTCRTFLGCCHHQSQEEIEKVQKRRLEREQEKAAMEEELAMIQRQRAHAEAVELEAKEEVVRETKTFVQYTHMMIYTHLLKSW